MRIYLQKERKNQMHVYIEDNISNFLTKVPTDPNLVNVIAELRNILINYDAHTLLIENQRILTENDLKCIIFHRIKSSLTNIFFEIHSEEADRISITDDYCVNLTEPNDIDHQTTRTRKTDLTITLNPEVTHANTDVRKGHTLNGDHIDIELKYIREGYNAAYLKDIRRDLCKLKYLVDPTVEHFNENDHGVNKFGIFILGFNKLSVLRRYLDHGLREKINHFNTIDNVCILLAHRDND